jgi:hypothetical protein
MTRLTREFQQIIAQREAAGLPIDVVPEKVRIDIYCVAWILTNALFHQQKVQEANEQRWAEAAQAVLRGRGPKAG